jgi:hypothetical protein
MMAKLAKFGMMPDKPETNPPEKRIKKDGGSPSASAAPATCPGMSCDV